MKTKQIFENTLKLYENGNMATYRNVKSCYKVHGSKLPKNSEEITKSKVIIFCKDIKNTLSANMYRNVIIRINKAFKIALEDNLISKNPFSDIKYGHRKIPKIYAFTPNEVDILIKNATCKLKNFIGVGFYTGLRGGEILALQWDDIDFEKMTIHVSKSVSEGICQMQTKTKIDRDIPIFKNTIPFLENLQNQRKSKWVFDNGRGDHYWGIPCFYRNWYKLLKKCNIKYRSMRHTRHTFATNMVNIATKENPIKLLWVSKILGHSNLQMTLSTYVRDFENEHLLIDRDLQIY